MKKSSLFNNGTIICLLIFAACRNNWGTGTAADTGLKHDASAQKDAGRPDARHHAPDGASVADSGMRGDAGLVADHVVHADAGPQCSDECQAGQARCVAEGIQRCGQNDDDPCVEWGEAAACPQPDIACQSGQCVNDIPAILAILQALHLAVEAEDAAATSGFFDPAVYDPSRTELDNLNAVPMTLPEIGTYFAQMFRSLRNIRFDSLATSDGLGNQYRQIDQRTVLIADVTPLNAVVEDPSGGYSFVSDYNAGDAWYEERSEGWWSFLFLKVNWTWKIAAFGIGYQ